MKAPRLGWRATAAGAAILPLAFPPSEIAQPQRRSRQGNEWSAGFRSDDADEKSM